MYLKREREKSIDRILDNTYIMVEFDISITPALDFKRNVLWIAVTCSPYDSKEAEIVTG